MDKEALLSIILNDLSEIETLIKSFQGQANIPNAFIELTEKKVSHLTEELNMLKGLGANTVESKPIEKTEPIKQETPAAPKEIIQPDIIPEAKAEELTTVEPIATEKESIVKEEIIENKTTEKLVKETSVIEEKPIIEAEKPKEIVEEKPTATAVKTEAVGTKTEQANNLRLGETLQKGKRALNDQVTHADISKNLLGKPVADLSKGLGINDRFLYQRELFNGNATLMSDTLGQLNEMDSFESALTFLKSNFNWENEELSKNFFNYVQRRF
ncbi:hypothetical protein [Saccharicrinis aurantiacus]|uniref:hypothetical protein n=1 Tax=Saccharicrinis aurantiacus TaxID=1849719 RepID=UPI00248F8EFF|nr:hypothetical protein [Saccharicrinis aurantiacus]